MTRKKRKTLVEDQKSPLLTEEELNHLLQEYGAEDLYQFVFEPEQFGGEEILRRDIGYEDLNEAFQAFLAQNGENNPGRQAIVISLEDNYYYFEDGAIIGGDSWGDWDSIERYRTWSEVEDRLKRAVAESIRPIREQIKAVKEKLPFDPEEIYLKPWHGFPCSFRVYYQRKLVCEHLPELDADIITKAVQKFHDLEKELGIEILELYKPGREWNSNQRYYRLVGRRGQSVFSCEIHIPSRTQHQFRYVADIIQNDRSMALQNALQEAKKVLTEKEKKSLYVYLLERYAACKCGGDYALVTAWMQERGIPSARQELILEELQQGGGFCDCEVMWNYFCGKRKT